MKKLAFILLWLLISVSPTYGDLIDRGNGMIYDTVLNVTWLQDANYARTSGYDADGRMTWNEATTWATNLTYGGYSDWRLPRTLPINGSSYTYTSEADPNYYIGRADRGFNISAPGSLYAGSTGSEMAYMYYNNLGNLGAYDLNGTWRTNQESLRNGPFTNLQSYYYWSGTEVPTSGWPQGNVFGFNFANGGQGDPTPVNTQALWAWAVRDGDYGPSVSAGRDYIATVTLGGAFSFDYYWLMGQNPDGFNMDIFFFRDNSWHLLGGDINFDGSSSEWETISLLVPHDLQGRETQIRFSVYDFGAQTDPTVYLRNIQSASVPEPSALMLLGVGLLGLAGIRRKFRN